MRNPGGGVVGGAFDILARSADQTLVGTEPKITEAIVYDASDDAGRQSLGFPYLGPATGAQSPEASLASDP